MHSPPRPDTMMKQQDRKGSCSAAKWQRRMSLHKKQMNLGYTQTKKNCIFKTKIGQNDQYTYNKL
jgi:hypothetical protein